MTTPVLRPSTIRTLAGVEVQAVDMIAFARAADVTAEIAAEIAQLSVRLVPLHSGDPLIAAFGVVVSSSLQVVTRAVVQISGAGVGTITPTSAVVTGLTTSPEPSGGNNFTFTVVRPAAESNPGGVSVVATGVGARSGEAPAEVPPQDHTTPEIEDIATAVVGRHRCKLLSGPGLQTIAHNTLTSINFDTEFFDVGGLHDTGTNPNRVTIPATGDVSGVWLFVVKVEFFTPGTTPSGHYQVFIQTEVGATVKTIKQPYMSTTEDQYVEAVGMIINPSNSAWFEVQVRQTTGGDVDVLATLEVVHLW